MEEEATQASPLPLSQQSEMGSSSLPVLVATPLPGLDGTEQDRNAVRLFWLSDCMRSPDMRRTISVLALPIGIQVLVMRADASRNKLSPQGVRYVRGMMRSRMITLLNKLIASERQEIDRLALLVAGPEWPVLRQNFYQRVLNHMHDLGIPYPEEDVLPVSWLSGIIEEEEEQLVMTPEEQRLATNILMDDLTRLADVLRKFKAAEILDSTDHLLQLVMSWVGISFLQTALNNLLAPAPLEGLPGVTAPGGPGSRQLRVISVDSPTVQRPLASYAEGILYTRLHSTSAAPIHFREDRVRARELYEQTTNTYLELVLAGMLPSVGGNWLASWEAPTVLQVSQVALGCKRLARQAGAKNIEELLMELLDEQSLVRGYLNLFESTAEERVARCAEAVLGLSELKSPHMIRTSAGIVGGTLRWVSPMYYFAHALRLKLRLPSRSESWLDENEATYVDAVLASLVNHGFTPAWIDDSSLTNETRDLFDTETATVRYQLSSTLHVLMEMAPFRMLQAVLDQPQNSLLKLSTRAAINKRTTMDGLGLTPLHVLLSSGDAWLTGTPRENRNDTGGGARVYYCLLALIGLGADPRQKDARGRDALAHLVGFVRENFLSGAQPVAVGYDFEQVWPFDNDTAAECLDATQSMLVALAKSGADFRQAEPSATPVAPGATPFPSPAPTLPPTLVSFDQPMAEVTELELGEEEEEEEESTGLYSTPVAQRTLPPRRLMDQFLLDATLTLQATEVLHTVSEEVKEQMRDLVATIRDVMAQTSRKRGFDPGEANALTSLRAMRISKACAQTDLMLTERAKLKSAADSMALAHAMGELKLCQVPQPTSPRPAGAQSPGRMTMPFTFH